MKKIAKFLRLNRERKSWTQEEMAERLGISCGYYKQVELGNKVPGVQTRSAISKLLRVSAKRIYELSITEEE